MEMFQQPVLVTTEMDLSVHRSQYKNTWFSYHEKEISVDRRKYTQVYLKISTGVKFAET